MDRGADLNQNLTVKGGPSLDVKRVSEVKLSNPPFDVNADNRTMVPHTATMSGSTGQQGDIAKQTLIEITTKPQPRKQMAGQRNSKHYNENGKSFETFPGNLTDSDAGN